MTPHALLSFAGLVAASYALDAVDAVRARLQRAHLLSATCGRRAARGNGGKAPRDADAYETACAAWCSGASHQ